MADFAPETILLSGEGSAHGLIALTRGIREPTVSPIRCPDRDELKFTMLMFIVLAPLGYWIVWTLFALVAANLIVALA